MSTPTLLLAAAVLFWGLESKHVLIGVLLAAIIGAEHFMGRRWKLEQDDFIRVSDLTSIIFLAAAAIILLNVDKVYFLKTVIVWQPAVLLPLLLAQIYTGQSEIVIGTRFGFRRKQAYAHEPLDFKIYYLGVCLVAAAMANSRSLLFFPFASGLLFWLLFVNRGRRFSRFVFSLAFIVVLLGGFFGFKVAETAHQYVREKTRHLMRAYYAGKYTDPFQSHLSYGNIGQLKFSGKIILRVTNNGISPGLLRQASYATYHKDTWHSKKQFEYLLVRDLGWDLQPQPHKPDKQATIEYYLPKEQGLLPQPYGSYRVTGTTLYELSQKKDGIVRIVDGAPLIRYTIFFSPDVFPPVDIPSYRNLAVQQDEKRYLAPIVDGLQLDHLTVEEKIQQVRQFFGDGFTYSLRSVAPGQYASALERFLLSDRSGYCELFATATALMLRQAGVPSRYVTGYVVSEKSTLENKYVVRDRHSHAWAEAFVHGRWVVVDTTPADWLALEKENGARFEKVQDLFSYFKLKYDHFRIGTEQNYTIVLTVVVVILTLILIFRIYRRMNAQTRRGEAQVEKKKVTVVDSPFYRVMEKVSEYGIPRKQNESFLSWAAKIEQQHHIDIVALTQMFHLHQRLRFDPEGLKNDEQKHLSQLTAKWLATYGAMTPADSAFEQNSALPSTD